MYVLHIIFYVIVDYIILFEQLSTNKSDTPIRDQVKARDPECYLSSDLYSILCLQRF